MNNLKQFIWAFFSVMLILLTVCPISAEAKESNANTTETNDVAIEYLKEMEASFNSPETLQEIKNTMVISEYSAKRDGNILTLTYKFNSILDFDRMTDDEKQVMANQSIQYVKSMLGPEELKYHEKGLVTIKFVWIDKAGRFYTAKF